MVDALVDITYDVAAGEVLAVVGPNGAGKSTLFSLLLGFLEPTGGDIAINGSDPRRYVRNNGVGYLPERFRLPSEWRVNDVLHAFTGLDRVARSRAREALERFGLAEHANKNVGALSHGMIQRLGLAQALYAQRALIVLDEPTEGLDAYWRVRFRDLIAEQRARGATVLIASHDLNELERLADRALLLDAGRVREVISLRDRTGARSYHIALAEASTTLNDVFPGARQTSDERTYLVEVSDVADLNRRLAALLATGATVVSVTPADTLEQRVTRNMEGQS